MKDDYPSVEGIAETNLVAREAQPDYLDEMRHWLDSHGLAVHPPFNVGYQLADAQVSAGRGDAVAAIHADSGSRYTFAQIAAQSSQLAAGLTRLGLRRGERVAYCSANDPCVLVVMFGIWKAGGVLVPIPHNARKKEVEFYLEDTKPRFLFIHDRTGAIEELAQTARNCGVEQVFGFGTGTGMTEGPLTRWTDVFGPDKDFCVDVHPDQVAIVWHTGGTTGRPKGCYHTHARLLLAGWSFGLGAQVRPGQRWCAAAPIGHALCIIHSTIFVMLHGATSVFVEGFTDVQRLMRCVDEQQVTTLTALMITWGKMGELLKAGMDWSGSSLQRCYAMWQTSSSAEVFDFWRARGLELFNNFGSTSFANWVLIPPVGKDVPRAALGKAQVGYQVEAVDIVDNSIIILPQGQTGRMAVRGLTGLTYWNLPDMQARDVIDGWTVCDDLIRFDEQGYAHYLGRSDYMISTAGFKVAPAEVELALSHHPLVLEVAVVPAPCPIRQEMVVAFVVPRADSFDADGLRVELKNLVSSELSAYKAPRRIEFVKALPRDNVGKVQSKIVMQWALELGTGGAR